MRAFLFTILNFTIVLLGYTQNEISFLIKDQATNVPIENVFLFIENTTIGAVTDPDGRATLSTQDEHFNIVITHIIYETQNISSNQLYDGENLISLVEKTMSLNEVTVKSKKVNLRKRKKWLKRFEEAFLGTKRRKIELLNPEVLWFEENDTTLIAHAIDNLKILNRESGYELQFVLESFILKTDEEVQFAGKLFFKDILDQSKRKSRIEKKRKENYLRSQQLFFRSLVHRHPANDERFEFGRSSVMEDGQLQYNKAEYNDLVWSYGMEADTLLLDGYLTVINKDIALNRILASRAHKTTKLNMDGAASMLRSKSGRFIIGTDGYLHNQNEIEEWGQWTTMRMAKELPRNFQGPVIFNESSPKIVIDKLLDYRYDRPVEKVYIHTDKSRYLPYENMWMKGYVIDAVDHRPSLESDVLYVDLLNAKDEIIQTWLLHQEIGFEADYHWKGSDPPGEYLLRGYTNVMRNYDTHFFFEKKINLQELTPDDMVEEGESMDHMGELDVSFYPEGGDLIVGVSNNVTFQAKENGGHPVDLIGEILDNEGNHISNVSTFHRGLGSFIITPEAGKTYVLQALCEEQNEEFDLPQIFESGLSLSVNPNEAEDIYVTIAASEDRLLNGAFLIGHIRGEVFCFVSTLENGKNLKFSKSSLDPGLVHFTLFDGQERPQAERIIFNDFGYADELITEQFSDGVNQNSEVVITVDSSLVDSEVDISMSLKIADSRYEDGLDIKNYLLLESDMTQRIPNKDYYLKEIDNVKRYHLDLMMRCAHWRRFNWKDILIEDEESIDHPVEKRYTISGHITHKEDSVRVQAHVLLTSLGPELVNQKMVTDQDGNFSFTQLPYADSATYIIQARIHNGQIEEDKDITQLEGNRLVEIYIDDFSPVGPTETKQDVFHFANDKRLSDEAFFELREEYIKIKERDSTMWMIDAPDVSITARRSFTSNRMNWGNKLMFLDNMDWIQPTSRGTGLLTSLAPQRRYRSGPDPSKIYSVFFNRIGEEIQVPIQIIIDGMGDEPGGSNAGRFWGLSADRIESIFISKTAVVITTLPRPRSVERYMSSGILHLMHPGYYRAREFNTDFIVDPDNYFETTIYWNPDVTFDESGHAKCSIPNLPANRSYILDVQGVSGSGSIINLERVIER